MDIVRSGASSSKVNPESEERLPDGAQVPVNRIQPQRGEQFSIQIQTNKLLKEVIKPIKTELFTFKKNSSCDSYQIIILI